MVVKFNIPFIPYLTASSLISLAKSGGTVRIAILILGLVGTFIAAAVPPIPVADGGPILVCPPRQPNCRSNLPLAVTDEARAIRDHDGALHRVVGIVRIAAAPGPEAQP